VPWAGPLTGRIVGRAMSTTEWSVDREFLAKIPIFGGLAPEILDRLIAVSSTVHVPAGTQLLGEGEPALCVFVVCEGELEIRKRGTHGSEFRLAMLHPGDCVGEMSLIDIQPRSATVRATSPAVLLRLDHGEIAKLYRSNPEVYTLLVLNIAREISRRLRRADQVLADMGVVVQDMWTSANGGDEKKKPHSPPAS
jgi:CRP/FNR family cyclic AMP-dependent transcriptional regulator